jgi:hypothetical protein
VVRAGRPACRAQPVGQRRRPSGAADAPRRPVEHRAAFRRDVVSVQERLDHDPRRASASSTTGTRRRSTSRHCGSMARVRWTPSFKTPAFPIPTSAAT